MSIKNFHAIYFIGTFFLSLSFLACLDSGHYELSRFIPPETCGGCHYEIYSQWKNSLHNQSHNDPIYRGIALHDLKNSAGKDELSEAELCVKCHTPIGFASGMPAKTSDHLKTISPLAKEGIQCDYCHSVSGIKKIYNAMLKIDPGYGPDNPGVKRGPFGDSDAGFHKSAYSELHTRSEFCGSCHDVRHVVYGTFLETPYAEWKNGPYNSKDPSRHISCQGCHMFQRPGVPATGSTPRPMNPGEAASGGPRRGHIFTHYFAGGNTFVPGLFGNQVLAKMAEERLRNAAVIKISSAVINSFIEVSVVNTGAGHSIPTGLSHVREMWIEVIVKAASGAEIFHSGKIDENGEIEKKSTIFRTVFGDDKNRAVMNVSKAKKILSDNRIGPKKAFTAKYPLPQTKETIVRAEARLLYRLASQKLIDDIFGRGKMKLPIVEMAKDSVELRLR